MEIFDEPFINKRILRIKNFKSLKDVEINFRKITLLSGANGSGKSSVI